jgi:hypothetical protein
MRSLSGVIGIERHGESDTRASGLLDSAHGVANTVEHRFGIAGDTRTRMPEAIALNKIGGDMLTYVTHISPP